MDLSFYKPVEWSGFKYADTQSEHSHDLTGQKVNIRFSLNTCFSENNMRCVATRCEL